MDNGVGADADGYNNNGLIAVVVVMATTSLVVKMVVVSGVGGEVIVREQTLGCEVLVVHNNEYMMETMRMTVLEILGRAKVGERKGEEQPV